MADILSQEEIDALLDVVEECCEEDKTSLDISPQKHITLYNFKRPNKVKKREFRVFREIYDIVAENLDANLTFLLEKQVEIQLYSLDQMRYNEFLMSLPNPTYFVFFGFKPFNGDFVLELNPSIAFPIIDILLGGKGEPFDSDRSFTNLELKLLDNITNVIFNSFRVGWRDYMETLLELKKSYSNIVSNVSENVSYDDTVIMISMEIIIGHSAGMFNIALPIDNIDIFIRYLSNDKEE